MEHRYKSIHFIGIGGVGMYSLARISLERGIAVSGSDTHRNAFTEDLAERGARIFYTHSEKNVKDVELLVYTLAISDDNPELIKARSIGVPILMRAEFMAKVMEPYKNRIAVSGSHGKSTVTAMLAHIFLLAGKSPTVIAGAPISDGMPTIIGSDDYLIYEACEYKDSFLKFSPTSVTVTNLELDHTDYFKTLEDIKKSFTISVNSSEKFAVINTDDQNLSSILGLLEPEIFTFGAYGGSNFTYSLRSFGDGKIVYSLKQNCEYIGDFSLSVPGTFNVSNAVSAIVTAYGYGIPLESSAKYLESFRGVERRMQHIGYRNGRSVFYDYAHHPTEIIAVINSLKETEGTLTVVFRPHTYTRTRDLWDAFVRALSLADYTVITDIFAAREAPISEIDSEHLAIACGGVYSSDEDAVHIIDRFTSGAIVLMGAGDLDEIKNALLDKSV